MNHVFTLTEFRSEGTVVYLDELPLDPGPSQEVWNHSPGGFAWGYGGSGPAQLALAILLRFTDAETAVRLHQTFKFEHVAKWPQDEPLDQYVDVRAWLGPFVGTPHDLGEPF
jgi:Family of unknown function (DUF6166)